MVNIVVGLDGAGFHLLERWLDNGALPNLSELMDGGSWQRLRSVNPPVTSPAWRCYSSGVNPGKNGVFWWEELDRDEQTITVPDSRSFNAKDVWDYLGDHGYTSGVVNMPTTHPPQEIDGWLVSGVGFDEDYTYPEDLEAELERELDYQNSISVPKYELRDDPDKIDKTVDLIDMRFEVARYLRDKYDPDFLHLTVFVTNAIQHHVWGGEATRRMWKCVDRNVGELLTPDDNVIIMSDHGSNRIESVFYVNTWFEQEDYLETTFSPTDVLSRLGVDKEMIIKAAETLNLKDQIVSIVPKSIVRKLPGTEGGVGRDAKEFKIDWEETDAVASGQGPVYVLADGKRGAEIKAEIIEKLQEITTPDGEPVARNVSDAAEVYSGPYAEDGPDIVVEQADGIHIPDKISTSSVFVDPDEWKWESENHRDGIFIAHGPDIAAHGKLEEKPTLYDLAPTILHSYGVPIPKAFDGDVLTEIFDTADATGDVEYNNISIETGEGAKQVRDEEMRNRLKDLGYISD